MSKTCLCCPFNSSIHRKSQFCAGPTAPARRLLPERIAVAPASEVSSRHERTAALHRWHRHGRCLLQLRACRRARATDPGGASAIVAEVGFAGGKHRLVQAVASRPVTFARIPVFVRSHARSHRGTRDTINGCTRRVNGTTSSRSASTCVSFQRDLAWPARLARGSAGPTDLDTF